MRALHVHIMDDFFLVQKGKQDPTPGLLKFNFVGQKIPRQKNLEAEFVTDPQVHPCIVFSF